MPPGHHTVSVQLDHVLRSVQRTLQESSLGTRGFAVTLDERDIDLWRDVRQCEEQRFEATNRFLTSASDPVRVLKGALLGGAWDRVAALRLLVEDRDATRLIAVFPVLLELASGMHGFLDVVREAIRRTPRAWLDEHLREEVLKRLATEDDSGYRRLAELLSGLGYNDLLDELVGIALESPDKDIREVGEDFAERPRPLNIFG